MGTDSGSIEKVSLGVLIFIVKTKKVSFSTQITNSIN